jgi:hypothetical protein
MASCFETNRSSSEMNRKASILQFRRAGVPNQDEQNDGFRCNLAV